MTWNFTSIHRLLPMVIDKPAVMPIGCWINAYEPRIPIKMIVCSETVRGGPLCSRARYDSSLRGTYTFELCRFFTANNPRPFWDLRYANSEPFLFPIRSFPLLFSGCSNRCDRRSGTLLSGFVFCRNSFRPSTPCPCLHCESPGHSVTSPTYDILMC